MSLRARSVTLASALSLFIPIALCAAVVPTANTQREEVRKQLSSFFASSGEQSPAGFKALQQSPEAMKEVQKRIAGMSDQEVAEFHAMMADTPDWKSAPEALTRLLPPEMLKQVQATSADFTARMPRAEKMRADARTLATVLKALPDEKLRELGVQRASIDALEQSLAQLNPLQTAVLQKDLADKGGDLKGAEALAALPPSLRKGAAALAMHGEITALDMVELEKYRASLSAILKRVQALPEDARKSLHIQSLQTNIVQVTSARPDVLFMMREQIGADTIAKLDAAVKVYEHFAAMTPEDLKDLQSFRGDLLHVFEQMQPDGAARATLEEKVASLTPMQLSMMKEGMPDFASWQEITPAYYVALSSPGLQQRIQSLQQPTPDAGQVAGLESFRQQALNYIDDAGRSGVDASLVASARKTVAEAPLPRLEFVRTLTASMPATASAESRLRAVSNISLNCVVSLGSIDLGDVLGSFSLGSINFNFICNPIADAINAVGGAIESAVSAATTALTNVINSVRDALQSAIDAVTNTVNTLVNGIISTVDTIWNFLQTVPGLAWDAIKSALNFLLDIDLGNGITLRALISDGLSEAVPKLQQALHLTGSWWNALGSAELPLIPCPGSGIHTPFGDVGSGDAVTKYNRYKFFIDKIIGLIPDTETSLEIKIPAQVLYAAFDYLGVCLQDAANDANDTLQSNRHTEVTTDISNVYANVTTTTTLLGQQLTISFNALTNLTNTQGASLITTMTNNTIDIENLINSKTTAQRDLDLRMQIEQNLQAGEGKALAAFELPGANGGYLELARDIVNNAISSMLATSQGTGQAQKWFTDAQNNINNGKFKDAYKSLQKAYSELTK